MIKNILFDLDGTVYIGNKKIDGVDDTFKLLKQKSIKYYFITNNSSTSKKKYKKKIEKMGIDVNEDIIYSSVDATIKFLKNNRAKRIFIIGTKQLIKTLSKDFYVIKKYNKSIVVDYVVIGFDKELTYKKIYDASLYIQDGSKIISTNVDMSCPIENNYFIPDCGSITSIFEKSLGVKTSFLGKPSSDIVDIIIEKNGLKRSETLIIGDRLNTDIQCGINSKIKTAIVLTGETKKNDVKTSKLKINYVLDSINDLKTIV